mgnify:CR=1 FL=1
MKVLILAGGLGTRLSEETGLKPKPMIEIGDKPLIWHIMKTYSSYGFNDFVVLLGYKGYAIKNYFSNYFLHQSSVTIDLKNNNVEIHDHKCEPWKVTLLETGRDTMTGGRIKKAAKYISDETFLLTYGDGLSDVGIPETIKFHKKHGKAITMTAVQPEGRYGALVIKENGLVENFTEKPQGDGAWINGGFFVCEPKVLDFIDGDTTVFEQEPLANLALEQQLMARKHHGFWGCMDTLRDKTYLNQLWENNNAPWKKW